MAYAARIVTTIAIVLAGAAALAGGDSPLSFVPWKVLAAADDAVESPLTLYWVPASIDELRRSDLLTSADLTLFSSRCVAMRVVRFDDGARLARLKVGAELPVALLVESGGRVIGRVESENGVLSTARIEDLVREELYERESDAEALLDEARRRAEARDADGALAIYKSVWEQRCVCPRQGKDAKRAMKKLTK